MEMHVGSEGLGLWLVLLLPWGCAGMEEMICVFLSILLLCIHFPGNRVYRYRRLSLSLHNFHGAGKNSLHTRRLEDPAMRNHSH